MRPYASENASGGSPNVTCDFDDACQLLLLVRFAERVAADGAREPALRAQAQLRDRCESRGFFYSTFQRVRLLELGALARNQAQHEPLVAPGQKAERLEAARASAVVLQKISVDVDLVEEDLRDRIVA